MITTTSNCQLEDVRETSSSRSLAKSGLLGAEVMNVGIVDLPRSRWASLPRLFLAATLTAPVQLFGPQFEALRSGSYSRAYTAARRRLSLSAARRLALRVLRDTDYRLQRERAKEAEFLASLYQPEP